MAVELGRSVRAVEMANAKLVKAGKLRHVGLAARCPAVKSCCGFQIGW
jgi:hypothetical protein